MKRIILFSALSAILVLCLASTISPVSKATSMHTYLGNMFTSEAKSIFLRLPVEQKREVWKAKLSNLDADDYNQAQLDFIRDVIKNIDTLKFDGTDHLAGYTGKAAARSKELFPKEVARELFSNLGRPKVSMIPASATFDPMCECASYQFEDFCGSTTIQWHCKPSILYCIYTGGCGFLWTATCNGLCVGGLAE